MKIPHLFLAIFAFLCGDDLLVVARTSRAGRNQHDNDLTTFHCVRNFRERAAFLLPGKK